MLKRRRRVDLDSEWRYHVLCVRRLRSTDRGLMYDNAAADSNDVPREGIGSGLGSNQPVWGPLVGRLRRGDVSYFRPRCRKRPRDGARTTVEDFGVMKTTDVLRDRDPAASQRTHWASRRYRKGSVTCGLGRPGASVGQSYESAPIATSGCAAPRAQIRVEPFSNVSRGARWGRVRCPRTAAAGGWTRLAQCRDGAVGPSVERRCERAFCRHQVHRCDETANFSKEELSHGHPLPWRRGAWYDRSVQRFVLEVTWVRSPEATVSARHRSSSQGRDAHTR